LAYSAIASATAGHAASTKVESGSIEIRQARVSTIWTHFFTRSKTCYRSAFSWKLALQIGEELFSLVGLTFMSDLLDKSWFAVPVITTVFAGGLHITDR
jgi:hypothetical protein